MDKRTVYIVDNSKAIDKLPCLKDYNTERFTGFGLLFDRLKNKPEDHIATIVELEIRGEFQIKNAERLRNIYKENGIDIPIIGYTNCKESVPKALATGAYISIISKSLESGFINMELEYMLKNPSKYATPRFFQPEQRSPTKITAEKQKLPYGSGNDRIFF